MAKLSFDSDPSDTLGTCEANIVPMIDVLLVLLVIFMVTAQTMNGVPLDLPKGGASASETTPQTPVTVSLDAQGKLFLQDKEVTPEILVESLKNLPEASTERLYIRAHKDLPYERVMELIVLLKNAKYSKICLLTDGTPRAP